jgi:hypothetical protein
MLEYPPVATRLPMLLIRPNGVNREEFLKVGCGVFTENSHRLLVLVDTGHMSLNRHDCMQKIQNRPATSLVDSSSME